MVVEFAGVRIADTRRCVRVLETSHPPVFCVPPQDMRPELVLQPELFLQSGTRSWCERKGAARSAGLSRARRVRGDGEARPPRCRMRPARASGSSAAGEVKAGGARRSRVRAKEMPGSGRR
ncbi:DUF427 domain-containing protein [Streptomyces sp. NPDC006450]|uniref:DUF427 domain-containing protein n=1 Tax=Streptomyces sp. NPDC006450 TaxID=3155458 RepID=UPI0033AEFF3C